MMRTLTMALVCLVAGIVVRSAQSTGVQPLPRWDAPAGIAVLSFGGYGQRASPEHASLDLPATGSDYRLKTTMSTEAIAVHYTRLLATLGWKQAFRAVDPQLAVARFDVGPATDPMTGSLTVIPFARTGEAVVSIRLVRSKVPWRARPRQGGAGANAGAATAALSVDFGPLAGRLTMPASVQWVESRGGGSSNASYHRDVRLETQTTTSVLTDGLLKQIDGPDWQMDARVGDATQTVTRRTWQSDGRRSEVWMLTSMPGVNQVDLFVTSFCATTPGRPKDPRARVPGSVPCANPQ